MTMFQWICIGVGLTIILTKGSVFTRPRNWLVFHTGVHLWECPMCLGFWVGVVMSIYSIPMPYTITTNLVTAEVGSYSVSLDIAIIVRAVCSGFVMSLLSWSWFSIFDAINTYSYRCQLQIDHMIDLDSKIESKIESKITESADTDK